MSDTMQISTQIFLISLSSLFALAFGAKYSGRFDNLNIEEILRNDRLLKNYFECLMGRGPCTVEGSELKRIIPEALRTECSKCSDVQKEKATKAVLFLNKNKPDLYKELIDKYDPEGIQKEKIRQKFNSNSGT